MKGQAPECFCIDPEKSYGIFKGLTSSSVKHWPSLQSVGLACDVSLPVQPWKLSLKQMIPALLCDMQAKLFQLVPAPQLSGNWGESLQFPGFKGHPYFGTSA